MEGNERLIMKDCEEKDEAKTFNYTQETSPFGYCESTVFLIEVDTINYFF